MEAKQKCSSPLVVGKIWPLVLSKQSKLSLIFCARSGLLQLVVIHVCSMSDRPISCSSFLLVLSYKFKLISVSTNDHNNMTDK